MFKNKKKEPENFNVQELKFTRYGFYEDHIALPDNYGRYYLTPEDEETTGDFFSIAKGIMNIFLQPYHTITCVQALNPRPCHLKKYCSYDGKCYFTARYYEFLEAHGLTENVFLDGVDKIAVLGKGLNLPITKLSIECVSVGGNPKELCSYEVYGYRTQPFVKSMADVKVYMESMTYDFLIEYEKFPDYLSVIFNRNTVDINGVIKIISDICKDYDKILRLDLV